MLSTLCPQTKSVTYRIFLFWSALFWPDESLEYSCTHIYLIFYRFHILWVCWCHKPNGAYRFVKSCSTDHNKLITNAQYITPTFLSRYYFTRDLHISGSSNNTTCRLIWLFTISVRYINQLILILIAITITMHACCRKPLVFCDVIIFAILDFLL